VVPNIGYIPSVLHRGDKDIHQSHQKPSGARTTSIRTHRGQQGYACESMWFLSGCVISLGIIENCLMDSGHAIRLAASELSIDELWTVCKIIPCQQS
jgi:hypothetical protein